jgi:hypothetical protein
VADSEVGVVNPSSESEGVSTRWLMPRPTKAASLPRGLLFGVKMRILCMVLAVLLFTGCAPRQSPVVKPRKMKTNMVIPTNKIRKVYFTRESYCNATRTNESDHAMCWVEVEFDAVQYLEKPLEGQVDDEGWKPNQP